MTQTEPLVRLDHVSKSFNAPGGGELNVLDDIGLELREREIVALLGRSGSGKSTVLRTIAGLIAPSRGSVTYRGSELNGANPGTAMVFQTFALMPWLTVQDNVELGLAGRGVAPPERRTRALAAIDLIGLDGFESAYPKELSGGMRQRVGFARALVLEPDVLLMDEPFSALDVLTAENLRTELMKLWDAQSFPTRSICLVTHNIEEAVQLADRVLVLGSNPGRIRAEVAIDLARPRDRRSRAFEATVDNLYGLLTDSDPQMRGTAHVDPTPISRPLPNATVGGLAGLVEILCAQGGHADLPDLAAELNFDIDDLLPLVDAAELLDLVEVRNGDLQVTSLGQEFNSADIQASKHLFAQQVRTRAPLVHAICQALGTSSDGNLRAGFFLDLLGRGYSREGAQQQLEVAVNWGRYAELYDYDVATDTITADPAANIFVRQGAQ
ncbi:nitrate/sulfonate/bicarbonate ABC transporter ATP-binding protein [Mycobacterium sp. DL592]|uniref:ABC transporter ATP-binding protein n=1 Tax=Mycobacterium sp. DL592 TaxID=2675524 RepID=UPI00141F4CA6|nr:nitrate/sulfonate/bicarbonate ABC transporter ATP-binding protein [Mycobacterium sp. DL592]